MSLSNEQRAWLGAWQTDKNRQTPYFRTYSRRALIDLPKLCMVIEDVETIKWTEMDEEKDFTSSNILPDHRWRAPRGRSFRDFLRVLRQNKYARV